MSTKRYAKIDETGRVNFAAFSSDKEAKENGYLPYEEEAEKPTTPDNVIPHNYTREYVEEDGKVIGKWEAYPNYEAIEKLKKEVAASDYKVIKCYEASLVGKELPYDMNEVHKERQEIRDEINRLEACE